MMVLLERLKAQIELQLSELQAGFRRDRSTVHQILRLNGCFVVLFSGLEATCRVRRLINWHVTYIQMQRKQNESEGTVSTASLTSKE